MLDPIRNLIYKLPPWARPIIPLIGGMLYMLTYGTIYTSGNIQPYIVSYLRKYVDDTLTNERMVWIFTLQINFPPFGISIGGLIERKYGVRVTCAIGAFSMSAGILLTYFTIQHSYALLLVTFAMMFGLGHGLSFGPPLMVAMKWLPNNRGLATGLVLAGLGAGGFVFSPIQTRYVNPWNYEPDENGFFHQEDLLARVPTLFLMLGCCYVAMQLIGCICMVSPEESSEEEQHPIKEPESFASLPAFEAIRSSTFWWLSLGRFFNAPVVTMTSSFYKIFGQTFIKDDIFLAAVGSAASVFNAGGRVFWGWLGDRYSFQVAMAAAATLQTALMLTFLATEYGGKAMYLIWVCGLYFGFSSNFTLFPLATVRAFGNKNFAIIYGCVLVSVTVASILMAVVADTLLDVVGFMGIWYISAGLVYCTYMLTVTIQKTDYGRGIAAQLRSRKTEVRLHYTE